MTDTMISMKILDHHLADLYWTPENDLFEEVYKETTANTTDEQLKEYSLQRISTIASYLKNNVSSVNGMIMDSTLFFYEMNPDLQKWIDENIVSYYNKIGLKKFAIIVSQGLYEQLAIEDASSHCTNKYEVKFFADTETAKLWILDSA